MMQFTLQLYNQYAYIFYKLVYKNIKIAEFMSIFFESVRLLFYIY